MVAADHDLTGVRVLVTGGTSGLGLAMVRALAGAGATVAFTGRTADGVKEVASGIPGAAGFVADVRDQGSVTDVVDAVWNTFGGIDMLVNNAGLGMKTVNPDFMTRPQGFWEVPVDGFRAVIDTNLTGYFLVAREITPRMLAGGRGRIVNISMNHSTMNRKGFIPYGPSRAGAEALSRVMAADLADTGVRVNMLLPGAATRTGMLPSGTELPASLQLLDPDVMAAPVVWLASEEAADVHDERIVATEFEAWRAERLNV
ncbi:N/A [soil metagenome]